METGAPLRIVAVSGRHQAGMSLVELMVALALGLLVATAAVAALIVARQGFTNTDASTQLRENGRFTAALLQRIADQGGFQDVAGLQYPSPTSVPQPVFQGYDNALILPAPPATLTWGISPVGLAHGTRTASNCGVSDTSCMNGSDILIVRYWGVSDPPGTGNPADGSMINCSGGKEPERAYPSYSIFSVVRSSSGEPTLACTYQTTAGAWQTVPLVTGVEAFQVRYGTNTVVAGVCTAAATDANALAMTSSAPMTTYLTATQMDGAGGYCANNWQYVRQLRIGLVMRSPTNAAVAAAQTAASYPVLSAIGASYPFSTAADVGSNLAVAADGRLRQQMVFTIQLHNLQQTRQ